MNSPAHESFHGRLCASTATTSLHQKRKEKEMKTNLGESHTIGWCVVKVSRSEIDPPSDWFTIQCGKLACSRLCKDGGDQIWPRHSHHIEIVSRHKTRGQRARITLSSAAKLQTC